MDQDSPQPDESEHAGSFGELSQALMLIGSLGFAMAFSIIGFFALGYWAGGVFGHPRAGAICGSVVGIGMALAWCFRKLLRCAGKRIPPRGNDSGPVT